MNNHTPKPWEVRASDSTHSATGYYLGGKAEDVDPESEEAKDTARLIEAAPEMYEALKLNQRLLKTS